MYSLIKSFSSLFIIPLSSFVIFSIHPANAASRNSESFRITKGVYSYSTPVVGEDINVQANENGLITFRKGKLTDRDSLHSVYWRGEKGAPRRMQVVFDLLADEPVSLIILQTQRPNEFYLTENVSVSVRRSDETAYRSVLYSRLEGTPPWNKIEIPLDSQPIRFVRLTFTRRHSYIRTPLSEVGFFSSIPESAKKEVVHSSLSQEFSIDTKLVDKFGQFLYEDWPDKIHTKEDLTKNLITENKQLDKEIIDNSNFDSYQGRKDILVGSELKGSGFFQLQKLDGRWWFLTPEGNPWLLNGVCATSFNEWGYTTSLTGSLGEPRGAFEELPNPEQYSDAYTVRDGNERVSFLIANLIDKYGPDWREEWAKQMKRRLRAWGFNANAKWHNAAELSLPQIKLLRPSANTRRILYAADPYDPDFPKNIEDGITETIALFRESPLVIGYLFESEVGWDNDVFAEMLRLNASSPAKQAFIDFLFTKYPKSDDLAEVLGYTSVELPSREALLNESIVFKDSLQADSKEFITQSSRRYYDIATRIIRRLDPNHLILGSALTPGWHSSYEWEIGAVDFVDALSFDTYRSDPAWIIPYLKYDMPILLLEYSFVVNDRGLPGFHVTVPSQRDRGIYYRHFIEHLIAHPQFVGAGWFLLYDQAVTGRDRNGGGESHNFGLINQQDQPYEDALTEMKKTAARLYDLHLGRTIPFNR